MNKGTQLPRSELTRLGHLALTTIVSEIEERGGLTSKLAVRMGILAALLGIADDLSKLVGIQNTATMLEPYHVDR